MIGGAHEPTVVLHLVWAPLGPAPLRAFADSYRDHDAGSEHELVIILNGLAADGSGSGSRAELLRELVGIPHRLIELSQSVLDLVAYRQAIAQLGARRVCVLNSHSRLRVDGWLSVLEQALARPGIGLVGASGSWASMRSRALFQLGLPSAYRRVWPDRAGTIAAFRALEEDRGGAPDGGGRMRGLYSAKALLDMTIGFSAFPAPHVRTNAFMAERELLQGAFVSQLRRKVDTHRLESGRDGLTRAVERAGLRVAVVDRAARSFEVEEWPQSNTFWQGDQEGLLVADNQTDSYEQGDFARRRLLSAYAWGERAAPSAPLG